MDLSVLERQRVMLQRIYQQNDHIINVDHQQQLLSQCFHHLNPDPQMATTSNNSSITGVQMSKPLRQCNSSFPINKRKAEFDIEEEENNEKGGEENEDQSEITTKMDQEKSINTCSKVSEVQKPDYIHVRARRGQATDSHSLAERARREKISKKMKCLQDLVPGCNKVTGKAGMLDEIINYVQSLQKQVEFLSMKLATLNPRLDFNADNLFSKEIPAYIASLPAAEAQYNATCFLYSQLQNETSNRDSDISMNQSQMLPQKSASSSQPIPELFLDPSYMQQLQQLSGLESDWPNLFNVGFH
ncbi:hypothetical protein BUALT_Bualt04G0070100 [Buddleja alternifolia]|uniref:BHLH domain-containing protein n=1 Tax=Buddleja alternifolia TaxID=168488 RepID=A0AAV6XNA6_9LAMI|nr:hypothetical protein BUALT_Bualt04G0070100 [Buddleja alternifolia]